MFSPRNPRALKAGSAPGYEVPRVAGIAGIAGTAGSKCCVLQTCVRDALVGGRHVDARWRTGRSIQRCMGGRIAGSWCAQTLVDQSLIWRFPKMVHPNHPLIHRLFHYKPPILGYPHLWYLWKPPYQQSVVLWLLRLWHRVCFEGSFYRGLRLQVLYQLHRGKQRSGLVPMVTYGIILPKILPIWIIFHSYGINWFIHIQDLRINCQLCDTWATAVQWFWWINGLMSPWNPHSMAFEVPAPGPSRVRCPRGPTGSETSRQWQLRSSDLFILFGLIQK